MSERPIPHLDIEPQNGPLKEEILQAWARILDEGAFCLGSEVETFEREFAAYSAARFGVGVNSGTSALHLALRVLDVGPGDEVITTPFTFVATAWAIGYCGARPVFADIQSEGFNLNPQAVAKAITPRTKAVIGVHLYGRPFDADELLAVAQAHKLPLIEDAAQAHGASYKGRKAGSLGTMACFSFYPSKNLGACGEAGMVVTSDETLNKRLRSLRNHASTVRYYHDELGYNYRMENIQAAVLRIKFRHLELWNRQRVEAAARYDRLLKNTRAVCPLAEDDRTHVYHLYVIRHPQRDALMNYLAQLQIGTAAHYPLPLHLQKAYSALGYAPDAFPRARQAANEVLSLPFYPGITAQQQQRVAEAIQAFERAH